MLMVCVWHVRTVRRVYVWVPVILCVWMDWRESEKARARTRRQFGIHVYTIYVQFTWHNHHPFWMCSPCAWCFVLVLVLTQATQLPLLLIPFWISHSSTGHPNLTFSYNHIQTRTNFWASLSFGWERIEHKINKRRAIAHRKNLSAKNGAMKMRVSTCNLREDTIPTRPFSLLWHFFVYDLHVFDFIVACALFYSFHLFRSNIPLLFATKSKIQCLCVLYLYP